MVGIFGGNLGGNGGSGARLSLVFDPWSETWTRNQDLSVGRWYPTAVAGADGRLLIMSGQSELGWGTPTSLVERFPAAGIPLARARSDVPRDEPVDRFRADAPFRSDYPHLFLLRDGRIYGFGRDADQQWVFDPARQTRSDLPGRPDGQNKEETPEAGGAQGEHPVMPDTKARNYGSTIALPGGPDGPNSVLVLGGDRNNPATYQFADGRWSQQRSRAFGRTQDDTLVMPDGTLLTVNGAYDIRDYGTGLYNPNAQLKYRQIELRDAQGSWKLGPAQRLPRGYHSNAVLLPDGRVMVTGDELQQIANNPDINSDMNGTIEIYEPAYLHRGSRPTLDSAPSDPLAYQTTFKVTSSTASKVSRAVLMAPITSTHSVDSSQRHVELRVKSRAGSALELQAPPRPAAAPPGFYMLFLLDKDGVPSVARWVQLGAAPRA
jgi:hypothetical protein